MCLDILFRREMISSDDKLAVEIDLVKYVSCRQNEINLLKSESFLAKENQTKSLFQLLPRHMRRRTMGYLRKRLPRRIRQQSTIKPPSKLSKRPSRKYRRKRSNLLKEYERRKRGAKMWLETHIWHAKRFKMSESLYEYKLPVKFHCKCKRAVFKCLKDYSCIHVSEHFIHQLHQINSI
jgi:ribonuclease P/MRP protein subunit POP1